jgi:3-methyl-2-oxobutanoate hydroxymethyltransferase
MPDNVTIPDLLRMKQQGSKITMLTAYDYPMGRLLDEVGIDVILVGDSLGMVVLGYETTTPVTMEEMLHHAKAVRRGVKRAVLIGDMPFMSFHGSLTDTVRNAGRFIQEAGCDAVKIEWKPGIEDVAKAIIDAGIAVMGHVGLTPQTAQAEGGFKEVGCFALVLECVPDVVAQEITGRLSIPTIGIGAGPDCDGQVLVTYDLLGLFERFTPKFVKRYADLSGVIRQTATAYIQEVRAGAFPGKEHTFSMSPDECARLKQELPK